MIAEERRKKLLCFLNKQEYTSLTTIFSAFPHISPSTIRRDLQTLTGEGRVVLLRGGAKLPDKENLHDLPIDSKFFINTLEKRQMSLCAAGYIPDNAVIYLDSSSSVYPILDYIQGEHITIVTTGVYTALKAMKRGFPCVMIGGTVRDEVGSIVGEQCCEQLRSMHFDVAFMSSNGFSLDHGISTPHPQEAAKIKIVEKNSKRCFFLLDSSKEGLRFTYKTIGIEDAHIISNQFSSLASQAASFTVADTDSHSNIDTMEDDTL